MTVTLLCMRRHVRVPAARSMRMNSCIMCVLLTSAFCARRLSLGRERVQQARNWQTEQKRERTWQLDRDRKRQSRGSDAGRYNIMHIIHTIHVIICINTLLLYASAYT